MKLNSTIVEEAKELYEQVQRQLEDGTFDVSSYDDMCDDDPNLKDLYYHFGRIEICVIYHVAQGVYELCPEIAVYEHEIEHAPFVNPVEYVDYEKLKYPRK